jgi:hypothetical protein
MPTDPFSSYPWYWYAVLVVMALAALMGAAWAHRVWREARGEVDDESCTTEDLLSPLVLAYKSGQMSEDEYRRIRDSLHRGETGKTALPPLPLEPGSTPPSDAPDRPPEAEPS